MDDCTSSNKSTNLFKMLLNGIISLLNVLSLVITDDLGELSIEVNRHWSLPDLNEPVLQARVVIVITEPRSAVHDTRTSVTRDEVCTNHCEALPFLHVREVVEQGHVALADELCAWDLSENLVLLDVGLLKDIFQAGFRKDVDFLLILILYLQVGELGVDGQG